MMRVGATVTIRVSFRLMRKGKWSNFESDLVARASRGDSEAFGDLYERYLDEIYRYIFYRVSDQDGAEDMTEMVFLKAWEALPRTATPISNFRAWLYRVAHNLVVDRHRTKKSTLSLEEAAELRDTAPTPETVAEKREESAELALALSRLKPEYRQVLTCRFINGLSHAETAEVMALKEGHVRVLQYRALRQVRQHLVEDV